MQWALISVTDKTGVDTLAHGLKAQGYGILASGGTARYLQGAGVEVRRLEDLIGFEALLEGRVKTLHPVVYAGILSQETEKDRADRESVKAPEISVVVVNLYDFESALAHHPEDPQAVIEAIDIGGVSLIRAAAKNFARVVVATHPDQYGELLDRPLTDWTVAQRRAYAAKAFQHMAYYDAMIGSALAPAGEWGTYVTIAGKAEPAPLRYGENPHQRAGWYRLPAGRGFAQRELLQGKPLSYNNVLDAEAAWQLALELPEGAVVAVKHQIPCGVALGRTALESYLKVLESDPVSIFGGIVAVKGKVEEELATSLIETFLEVVIAVEFTPQALNIFRQKKNLRILEMPVDGHRPFELRMISGGFLLQEPDRLIRPIQEFRHLAGPALEAGSKILADVQLAWTTVAHVRSNAIVIARRGHTVGIGGGETNRIDAARHALERAGERAQGAVLASDGFFPFGDVVAEAAKYGVAVVVEPGGALRDRESVALAEESGVTLLFSDERHFRH